IPRRKLREPREAHRSRPHRLVEHAIDPQLGLEPRWPSEHRVLTAAIDGGSGGCIARERLQQAEKGKEHREPRESVGTAEGDMMGHPTPGLKRRRFRV